MKNKQIKSALAGVVLSIMLFSLGCGGPQTNITNQNQNTNATVASNSAPDPLVANACSSPDINIRKTAVETAIRNKITGDNDLNTQYTNGVFKFQVAIGPGTPGDSLHVYLAGGIGNAGTKFPFHDLMTSLKGIHRLKCVTKVIFVKLSDLPFTPSATIAAPSGFEWFGCEDPYIPCPGGICAAQCLVPGGNTNTNTGSNSNSSSNSNSNMNSNSNSNSGSNKP